MEGFCWACLLFFQHHPASYLRTCTHSHLAAAQYSHTLLLYFILLCCSTGANREWVPCSRARCQLMLRESRVFTHSLYLPRISQLVWEIQNCSLLVTSHFSNLEATTTSSWVNKLCLLNIKWNISILHIQCALCFLVFWFFIFCLLTITYSSLFVNILKKHRQVIVIVIIINIIVAFLYGLNILILSQYLHRS